MPASLAIFLLIVVVALAARDFAATVRKGWLS